MPIHDLHCTSCNADFPDVMVRCGDYGSCELCGGERTWTPRGFVTDVYGAEVVDTVLREAVGVPLRYRTSREREKKMKRLGYDPAGDKVGGARNDDGYKRSLFSYRGQARKGTPAAPIVRSGV